jgi:hypothetical protein
VREHFAEAGVDVIGCNTLGIINVHDHVRIGAVGGENPEESFVPGSVTIISNSGNMVNTMASYLLSAGMGTSFGCSTGKDMLILTPPGEFLRLAAEDMGPRRAAGWIRKILGWYLKGRGVPTADLDELRAHPDSVSLDAALAALEESW